VLCAICGNRNTGEVVYEGVTSGLAQSGEDAIQVALESICLYMASGLEALGDRLCRLEFG
jgi:hypothetical protein